MIRVAVRADIDLQDQLQDITIKARSHLHYLLQTALGLEPERTQKVTADAEEPL